MKHGKPLKALRAIEKGQKTAEKGKKSHAKPRSRKETRRGTPPAPPDNRRRQDKSEGMQILPVPETREN